MNPDLLDAVPPRPRAAARRNRLLGAALMASGILVILVLGVDWGAFLDDRPADERPAGLAVGQRAPEFEAANLDGELVTLSDLRGRVVLLNFWATWCGPCRVEMPFLQDRHEAFGGELAIVGVDFDEPRDLVANFVSEFGLTFEILLDPGGWIQEQFDIRGYPTSYFLDRDGVIRAVHIGVMSEGQLDGYLADLGLD